MPHEAILLRIMCATAGLGAISMAAAVFLEGLSDLSRRDDLSGCLFASGIALFLLCVAIALMALAIFAS